LATSIDNCSLGTKAEHTAGLDCDGPSDTVLYSGELPIYFSTPFFNQSELVKPEAMNVGQTDAPYEPLERVTITPCTGSASCRDESRFKWKAKIEPETGRLFDLRVPFMLSARVGFNTEALPKRYNFQDSLIPVAWEVITAGATHGQYGLIVTAQEGPGQVKFYRQILLYVGLGLTAISCLCGIGCLAGFCSSGKPSKSTDFDEKEGGEE